MRRIIAVTVGAVALTGFTAPVADAADLGGAFFKSQVELNSIVAGGEGAANNLLGHGESLVDNGAMSLTGPSATH